MLKIFANAMHRQRIPSAAPRARCTPRHRRNGEGKESPTDNGTATGEHLVCMCSRCAVPRRRGGDEDAGYVDIK
jgi:hypothetical protein